MKPTKHSFRILGGSIHWLVIIVGLITMALFIASKCSDGGNNGFDAVEFNQPTVLTNPVVIGQVAELSNGICNKKDHVVRIEIWLALKSENSGIIGGQIVDLVGTKNAGFPEDLQPKGRAGDCIAEHITELVRPGTIPPGYWSLTGEIEIRGNQFGKPGEVERLNISSNVFEVRPPNTLEP